MLLVRREVIYPTTEQSLILGHMGYAAYKLWNIGNYEKRNYQELGLEEFPNWYHQKKRLKDNFFYKNLPSQTAQDVLQRLQEAWKSFFVLQKSGKVANPRPPRFKQDKIDITFLKDAIVQTEDNVRLTIPKQLKTYLRQEHGVNANYLYLKTKRFSDIHIRELQVRFGEKSYELLAVYEVVERELLEDNGHYLAIDLGIRNTFTCYDSVGRSFLMRGFLEATHYCDKKIAYFQRVADNQQVAKGIKYPKKSRRVRALYRKRRHKVEDFIHKSTRYIADYCAREGISKVVIGNIKYIRKKANLGRHNQQLHALPYNKIYQQLAYKLQLYGIEMILISEAYTSQCSPHSLAVEKTYASKSNRVKRGLYKEGKQIYNADCVGAYNILRKYCLEREMKSPKVFGLESPQSICVSP